MRSGDGDDDATPIVVSKSVEQNSDPGSKMNKQILGYNNAGTTYNISNPLNPF